MTEVTPIVMVSPVNQVDLHILDRNVDPYYYAIFRRRPVIFLSIGQVIVSLLVILCQILGMIYPYEGAIFGSPAMYCGLLFGFSGSFGIWAGYHTSKCTIMAHMVLAILSACFAIPLMAHSIISPGLYNSKLNID